MSQENTQQPFPVLNLNELQVITQYSTKPPGEIAEDFVRLNEDQSNDPKEKFPKIASSIASLQLTLESYLYAIEDEVADPEVSIMTLPHHTGGDHERISVIQPAAWIANDSGSYYDPTENRFFLNCVNHWEGSSSSISSHVKKILLGPCFLPYHVIVVISFILAFVVYFYGFSQRITSEHPSVRVISLIIIIITSVAFDLIAIIFVIFMEIIHPREGKPWLANNVQKRITSTIDNIFNQFIQTIPGKAEKEDADEKPSKTIGTFLLHNFYEPSITLLMQNLKVHGLYDPRNASKLPWQKIEDLLVIYRFVREISDSLNAIPGVEEFRLDSQQVVNMRKFLITAIEDGSAEVHLQLLRLLHKSTLNYQARSDIIRNDPRDLSLNHYLGEENVEAILSVLKRDIVKPKTAAQKRDPTIDQRRLNIQFAMNHGVSTTTTTRTRKSVTPSKFELVD
ncbi:hypothetical protein GPJ56_000753 [Histomonas meleagridis]|uniref:uncharacterized protein n=1 Tax=Histomonas meleagridis TaxID=135588 RepID=UPI00355AACF5|nr:hypothetical protein GPJ56_000753 [Histomonas meleagridis]KAH0804488.1 hypothetical protein GO595_003318 [Histomonas meleagridis]